MPAFYILCVIGIALLIFLLTPFYYTIGAWLKAMFDYTKNEITYDEKENEK